jgi:anti-sigma factor RsiW
MPDGYSCSEPGDCSYSALDELLCEYVDGAMDPDVCEIFEEYLRANPSVAARADRLRRARHLLCQHRCQVDAPCAVAARVQRRLACRIMQDRTPVAHRTRRRLGTVVTGASAVVVLVLLGMVAGTWLSSEMHRTATGRTVLDLGEAVPAAVGELPLPMTPLAGESSALGIFGRAPHFAPSASRTVPDVLHVSDTLRTVRMQRTRAAP